MAYEYTESGLKIRLYNGYEIVEHPEYGEMVSIHNVLGLHDRIGHDIATQHRHMTGAEFRFLRRELELSQGTLAGLLGTSEQNISLWERDIDAAVKNRSADRLLRAIYLEAKNDGSPLGKLLAELAVN